MEDLQEGQYFLAKMEPTINNNMNILFLIEHLQGGGAERVISELSAALEVQHNVYLAYFEEKETSYKHCKQIININVPGTQNLMLKFPNFVKRCYRVFMLKRKLKIDVCISFITTANVVNVASGVCKTICSIRTVLSTVSKSFIYTYVNKIVLNSCDYVVTLSDYVRRDLIENFNVEAQKSVTIYNPLSTMCERILPIVKGIRDEVVFVTAGRMVQAKGHWHLLKIFAEFVHERPNSKLVILGDGPLRMELEILAERLSISHCVKFVGFVSDPIPFYQDADVFVMTSLWEGFGNVITEAMACGTPVISTNCPGGPQEIIDPENSRKGVLAEYGILTAPIPIDSIKDITWTLSEVEKEVLDSMFLIADNKDIMERYKSASLKRSEDFHMHKISNEWDNLIVNIVNNHGTF